MSKLKFGAFILTMICLGLGISQADANGWHGQEDRAGYLPAGHYEIPFVRVQWKTHTFVNGSWVNEYRYGKPLTAIEKQNVKNIPLTAAESKKMSIYQVGDMLFLLPNHFVPLEASVGMDGSMTIIIENKVSNYPAMMRYTFLIGENAQSDAKKWMPWFSNEKHVSSFQASPLYHHQVSAFRYVFRGTPVNGVAYYQPHQEFLQVMKLVDTHCSHAEKSQVLNFFLSNYVYHKSY